MASRPAKAGALSFAATFVVEAGGAHRVDPTYRFTRQSMLVGPIITPRSGSDAGCFASSDAVHVAAVREVMVEPGRIALPSCPYPR